MKNNDSKLILIGYRSNLEESDGITKVYDFLLEKLIDLERSKKPQLQNIDQKQYSGNNISLGTAKL